MQWIQQGLSYLPSFWVLQWSYENTQTGQTHTTPSVCLKTCYSDLSTSSIMALWVTLIQFTGLFMSPPPIMMATRMEFLPSILWKTHTIPSSSGFKAWVLKRGLSWWSPCHAGMRIWDPKIPSPKVNMQVWQYTPAIPVLGRWDHTV